MRSFQSLRRGSRHLLLPKPAEPVSLPSPLCGFRVFKAPRPAEGQGAWGLPTPPGPGQALPLRERGGFLRPAWGPAGAGGGLGPAIGRAQDFRYG